MDAMASAQSLKKVRRFTGLGYLLALDPGLIQLLRSLVIPVNRSPGNSDGGSRQACSGSHQFGSGPEKTHPYSVRNGTRNLQGRFVGVLQDLGHNITPHMGKVASSLHQG